MELKIRITTPKGQAIKAERRIRSFVLGMRKPDSVYISPEENEIVWVMSGSVRKMMKIQKNAANFDIMMAQLLDNKRIKKLADKKEDLVKLKEMALTQTTVEVIKEATQKEIDTYGRTWFQRIKETFTKKEED